ncbi:hypothetical protein [Kitasatospora griseola]|uniref:hypothetical protein n=1 Tax=Kitasatospora griseola TaxID=2064 RepID=UPI0038118345
MDDLFRLLVVRAPEKADPANSVQLPLWGTPSDFLRFLEGSRQVSASAVWAAADEFASRRPSTLLTDVGSLPLAPELQAFGAALEALPDPADLASLGGAVKDHFNDTPAHFASGNRFRDAVLPLTDALMAAVLSPLARLVDPDKHVAALRLLAVVRRIASKDATLTAAGAVAAALAAHVVLPQEVFPVDPSIVQPQAIADDWVVRQHISRYELGEIAKIENVLLSERRKHETKFTLTTQQTVLTEAETTTENVKDLQTTDRFDLKSEVSNTLKEDVGVKGAVSVKYDSSPWTVTANASVSYANSKSSATKVASDLAQDVVQRATSKVTERTLQRQTSTTTQTVEDDEDHEFDNTHGQGNVAGVYQWVNKVLKVQMFDLGPRLIFDITVPEPAALLWELASRPAKGAPVAPELFDALPSTFNTLADVEPYLSKYAVTGVTAPPADHTTVSASYFGDGKKGFEHTANLVIPVGYQAAQANVQVTEETTQGVDWDVTVFVGGNGNIFQPKFIAPVTFQLGQEEAGLPVAVTSSNVTKYIATIDITCELAPEAKTEWQLKTHDTITTAYLARLKEYKDALAALAYQPTDSSAVSGVNPDRNRQIERTELKRSAITLIAGPALDLTQLDGLLLDTTQNPPVPQLPPRPDPVAATALGRTARFLEEAIAWEEMNYFFYPYYWGREVTWNDRVLVEDADPLFADFLRAGEARVVVPVRKGFEADVHFFVTSGGRIWHGAPLPDVHDSDYLSIAQEIEAAQNPEIGTPGPAWETSIPTNQVYLRADGTLPTWKLTDPWTWTPDAK